MKCDPTFWLLARASGLTAYVLLTSSVLAGLVVKSRPFGTRVKPATVTDVHRFARAARRSARSSSTPDARARRRPSTSASARCSSRPLPYRPLWTGLGVLAGELMLPSTSRSACASGSARGTGGGSTGRPTPSSPSPRRTALTAGTDSASPGRSASTSARSAPSPPRPPGAHSSHPTPTPRPRPATKRRS